MKTANHIAAEFVFIVICLYVSVFLLVPAEVNAASWHDVYLKAGQTYDVSSASSNTTIYINEKGSFALKGKSSKVRVVINSKDAVVYLENGLELTPGALANVGQRTAAITLNDNGGTVRLITKQAAAVKLTGYFGTPAIEKEGVATKLIFDTENDINPGTITATAQSFSDSPGIGSSGKGITTRNVWTGNMEFNGGKIIAKGAGSGAGIGGATTCHVNGITIDGSTIEATGGTHAAGIGGGYRGNAKNITVLSGTVTAVAGEGGAGIGSGESDGEHGFRTYAQNIIIKGGVVVAKGDGTGAGIGGGKQGDARGIYIYGGTVTATGGDAGGTGIGGGGGNFFGTGTDINISGGTIKASVADHATGIGSNSAGDGETSVNISGGSVSVIVGANSIGIGGGGRSGVASDGAQTTRVNISGGTISVKASKGSAYADIGSNRNTNSKVIISGGSIDAGTTVQAAVDQYGNRVYKTTVRLDGSFGLTTNISGAKVTKLKESNQDYGMKDVKASSGVLYFWIPKGTEVQEAEVSKADVKYLYVGGITAGSSGTLHPQKARYQVSFDANVPENTASVITGTMEKQQFVYDEEKTLKTNAYVLKGYHFAGWNTKADGSG